MKYRRKTEKEISNFKKKQLKKCFNPTTPLLMGGIIFLLAFLSSSYLPTFGNYHTPPGPSFELLRKTMLFGIGVFVVIYISQIITRRPVDDDNYFGICNNCQKTDTYGKSKCQCGGKFEPKEFYKIVGKNNRK